jgi:AbiV family abortive infection protein
MKAEISAHQAFEGMQASLRNAEALTQEARILKDNHHPVRSIALSVLAWEELGKLVVYPNAGRCAREGNMKEWWKTFREHRQKIDAHNMLTLAMTRSGADNQTVANVLGGKAVRWLDDLKKAALYTDFRRGSFFCPLDLPDAVRLAESLVGLLELSLEFHQNAMTRINVKKLQDSWELGAEWDAELLRDAETFHSQLRDRLGQEQCDFLTTNRDKNAGFR